MAVENAAKLLSFDSSDTFSFSSEYPKGYGASLQAFQTTLARIFSRSRY